MANVTPARSNLPVLVKNQGLHVSSMAVANGDDLVLGDVEAPELDSIAVTPAVAVTALNSISDGVFPGQLLRFTVTHATNVFRIPSALGNVSSAANIDATNAAPVTLMWDGSAWVRAA